LLSNTGTARVKLSPSAPKQQRYGFLRVRVRVRARARARARARVRVRVVAEFMVSAG
jgi:hypothetical protein